MSNQIQTHTHTIKFLNETIDLGIIKRRSVTNIAWYFEGDGKDIIQWDAGCGSCTTDLMVLGNKFQGKFTESDSNGVHAEHHTAGLMPFTKYVTVHYKTTKPLHTFDDQGNKIVDPGSVGVILHFKGYVDLNQP